MQMHARPF